ncbi:MAG: 3-phosphoshikimate 1-carboxyvinyltransferase [Phycisphaerae bacterium]|nr:3-phosphoshikimate 1-carboxyvinyltransferase [Phycisphaerae bacterium]
MSDARSIEPIGGPFAGSPRLPGSKSLTNRFYVLAALAHGTSRISHPLRSDDTDRLLRALEILGVASRWEGDDVLIDGGGGRLPRGGRVDLGDGGTPTRFLLALATLAAGEVIIDGSPRMRERPVDEGIALLRSLGARIDARRVADPQAPGREVERLPVTVTPNGPLSGGLIEVGKTASSQFLSALLLIGPSCTTPLELRYQEAPTSASYLDLTIHAMTLVGAYATADRAADGTLRGHRVRPGPQYPFDVTVESDASSAVYFAVAAALMPGALVHLKGISSTSVQPDLRMLDALKAMGARVGRFPSSIGIGGAPELVGIDCDASLFPDASLALAVACAMAKGPSRIRGLETLTVKESDRITALATELTRIGCRCVATRDSIEIDPTSRHNEPVTIETYRDHRMAMSFAVLGLVRPGISIRDPECVGKSYPGFWSDLAQLRRYPSQTS